MADISTNILLRGPPESTWRIGLTNRSSRSPSHAATNGWVWLVGRMAKQVLPEKHVPFLIDLWAHAASYLGGLAGGMMLVIWVWRSRGAGGSR